MDVFGIIGWSGSGKTQLLTALLPRLATGGLTVSTVKHAHHRFEIDRPGKDSYRHREAGAREVLVAAAHRWVLIHENRGDEEPGLDQLLAHMEPVDLVLVEGFKFDPFPKIEVFRPALGKPVLYPRQASIVAVASDAPLPDCDRPVLDLNDSDRIAEFIVGYLDLRKRPTIRVS